MRMAVLFLAMPFFALACSCASNPPPCERFGEADAVFLGQVLEASAEGLHRVRVLEAFKGLRTSDSKEVQLDGGLGLAGIRSSCDVHYKPGEVHVFFARRRDGRGNLLTTGVCSGSFRVQARTDPRIVSLRRQAAGKSVARIYGMLKENEEASSIPYSSSPAVARVELTATGERGRRYTVRSNNKGEYEITGVTPGWYKIKAKSATHRSREPVYPAQVSRGGCAEVNIGMWSRPKKLWGRLRGPDGKPLAGVEVVLVSQSATWARASGTYADRDVTDDEGRFVFFEANDGMYLLGVNLAADPSPARPYLPTYFPGTERLDESRPVTVGSSVSHDFAVARRLAERKIRVSAVDESGQPLADVHVGSAALDSGPFAYPRGLRTGQNGEVEFPAMAEVKYDLWLSVRNLKARIEIPAGANDADVRVTLRANPK